MNVLSVSHPGGDRGPSVGYFNHKKALSTDGFSVTELNQDLWDDQESFKRFDVAWAYVRFHPAILDRVKKAGIPFIGGPNVVLERADLGITDEWERWYFEQAPIDVNLNVAEYYTNHAESFSKTSSKFRTLEYCYQLEIDENRYSNKDIDVTVYVKDRVNDGNITKISNLYCNLLKDKGLTYKVLNYGSYDRNDYIDACCRSKITAWFSIEDYCSLAQIESHSVGSAVIGTPYNLTIPVDERLICKSSQVMTAKWIKWESNDEVASDYLEATLRGLSIDGLTLKTVETCKTRHGYVYYRDQVKKLISEIKR